MEPAILGVVLDSSTIITAERGKLPVPRLIETIQTAHGEIEISLSPVTVAELVHGIYRAKNPEAGQRRRAYIEELVDLVPVMKNSETAARSISNLEVMLLLRSRIRPTEMGASSVEK